MLAFALLLIHDNEETLAELWRADQRGPSFQLRALPAGELEGRIVHPLHALYGSTHVHRVRMKLHVDSVRIVVGACDPSNFSRGHEFGQTVQDVL